MKQSKSPCIDVCQFTGPRGWCIGCGRTREECQQWKRMKPYARNALLRELRQRMARIERSKASHGQDLT